jgi:hypothetical protein
VAQAAAARAADWASFESFAEEVAQATEAAEGAVEEAYGARDTAAALENALYRARLDVVHFVRQRLQGQTIQRRQQQAAGSSGVGAGEGAEAGAAAADAGEAEDEDAVEGLAGAEFVAEGGSLSLLTASNASAAQVSASEVGALLRRRAAGDALLAARTSALAEAAADSRPTAASDSSLSAASLHQGAASKRGRPELQDQAAGEAPGPRPAKRTRVAEEVAAGAAGTPLGAGTRDVDAAEPVSSGAAQAPAAAPDGNGGQGLMAASDVASGAEDSGGEASDDGGWDSLLDWRSKGASGAGGGWSGGFR